jgi:hypothetical protein
VTCRSPPAHQQTPQGSGAADLVRPSRTWASVTPVVLDRHPKRGQRVEDVVADSVELAGYPRPVDVGIGQCSPSAASPRRTSSRLAAGRWTHVTLTFDRRVAGPLLVGKDRHFGMGLLRPMPSATRGLCADFVRRKRPSHFQHKGFASWYAERHGYPPFPWQAALAARIAAGTGRTRSTPPTGSGKTAVIDVWLWARLQGLPVPRRLVYVIDRRLVVDGVSDYATCARRQPRRTEQPGGRHHARRHDHRRGAGSPIRCASRHRLHRRSGRLQAAVQRLRDQPSKAASIHAGLLGNDALFVVDEVHLVRAAAPDPGQRCGPAGQCLPLPWRVLPMSATWSGPRVPRPQRRRLAASRAGAPAQGRQAGTCCIKLPADADLAHRWPMKP